MATTGLLEAAKAEVVGAALGEDGGDEVVAGMTNGKVLYMRDYVGADLDFDLDGNLYAELTGTDYQHKLKYKIVRTSTDKVIIKKVVIIVSWDDD